MLEFCVTIEWVRLAIALAGLVVFGVIYNVWVASLESQGHDRGYMSFIVAIGCAVTILAAAVGAGSWPLAAVMFAAFAASGLPMMVGSVVRYAKIRKLEERALESLARGLLRDEEEAGDPGDPGGIPGSGAP